ncbi:hypothetical protein H0W80_01790 [Candidatus Saccharibacteria bacterium]|nr:hypothetical protein [Candidatus Saccharibacteria bacterium]
MPFLKLALEDIYQLGGISHISKAQKYFARAVVHDPTHKHFLITGALVPEDEKRVGEFIAVVRPENPRRTYYQTWDAYSLGRSGKDSAVTIGKRRNELEIIRLDNFITVETLTGHWSEIRDNPSATAYFSELLSAHATKLLAAITVKRNTAGIQLAAASKNVDSLGRKNPSARAARIMAAQRRLEGQLEFDELSRNSALGRATFADLLSRTIDEELMQIDLLLRYGRSSTVKREFFRRSEILLCKPYLYGIRMIRRNGYLNALDNTNARNKIREVLFTERLLGQFSQLLSTVRDLNQDDVFRNTIVTDLEALIGGLGPTPDYTKLFALLRFSLDDLRAEIALNNQKEINRVIDRMKKTIRYREDYIRWPMSVL